MRGGRRGRFVAGQPDPAAFRFIRKAMLERGAANFSGRVKLAGPDVPQ